MSHSLLEISAETLDKYSRICKYLKENNMLRNSQHRFVKNKSRLTNLISAFENKEGFLNRKKQQMLHILLLVQNCCIVSPDTFLARKHG